MTDQELLEAYSGPRRPFDPAAAFVPFWFAWRGMWMMQMMIILLELLSVSLVMEALDTDNLWVAVPVTLLLWPVFKGVVAGPLRQNRARAALRRVKRRGLGDEEALAAMRRAGAGSIPGVVATVVIVAGIGYLADRLGRHSHDGMYIALMRSSLRDLALAQDNYFADHGSYSSQPPESLLARSYSTTQVRFVMGPVTATGWSATATYPNVHLLCGIFGGNAAPPVPGATAGEPRCVEQDDH